MKRSVSSTTGLFLALSLAAVPTGASANNWEKNYQPAQLSTVPVLPETGAPQVGDLNDFDADKNHMWERGYTPIGDTSFIAVSPNTGDAIKLGVKLKASYILISRKADHVANYNMEVYGGSTSTSTTSGTVNIQGSNGGSASGTYSGTTTTTGSGNHTVPLSLTFLRKTAIYFARMKQVGCGIRARALRPEERAAAGTNRGVHVEALREGSPGFLADILPGDIILAVDGVPVGGEEWRSWLLSLNDHDIPSARLLVFRKGEKKEIEMPIPLAWRGTPAEGDHAIPAASKTP